MPQLEFTTIDRVLAKFNRDVKDGTVSELDLIEWTGEALDFMKAPATQEEAVYFAEVKDHHIDVPPGFQMVLQVARNNEWSKSDSACFCPSGVKEEKEDPSSIAGSYAFCYSEHEANDKGYPVPLDSDGIPITDYEVAYYRPYFDLKWEYSGWTGSSCYKQKFTPIRLANHTFFNSIVAKEKSAEGLYSSSNDEYTIVGTIEKRLRFSFQEGQVALSYYKTIVDRETGYPLVPDHIQYLSAIGYYIKWKLAEKYSWDNREGFRYHAEDNERKWLKYVKQAKNYGKMLKGLDAWQNHLERTHSLIPNNKKYYNYFGNIASYDNRQFNTSPYGRR